MHDNLCIPVAIERREGRSTAEIGAVEAAADLFAAPPPVASLATLATQINQAHADAQAHKAKAVERALVAGDLLNSVKAQLKHGEFLPWCKVHCPAISQRTIQDYTRVARELPVEMRSAAHLSLREALRLVAGDSEDEPEPEAAPMLTDIGHDSDKTVGTARKGLEEKNELVKFTSSIGADGKERPRQVERKAPEQELLIASPCSRSPFSVLNGDTPEANRIDLDQLLESLLKQLPRGTGKTKDGLRKIFRTMQRELKAAYSDLKSENSP